MLEHLLSVAMAAVIGPIVVVAIYVARGIIRPQPKVYSSEPDPTCPLRLARDHRLRGEGWECGRGRGTCGGCDRMMCLKFSGMYGHPREQSLRMFAPWTSSPK